MRTAGRLLLLPALGAAFVAAVTACRSEAEATSIRMTGGDPARGKEAITRYGCGSCHAIPGVPGAKGKVGPPLGGLVERGYLAGRLRNTPENLMSWVRHPQKHEPGNVMPEMGVTEEDARHIAAYLYSTEE